MGRVVDALGSDSLPLTVGVANAAKAASLAALLRSGVSEPTLIIVPRADKAEALAEELAVWLGEPGAVRLLPERDSLPYERLAPDLHAVAERLRLLSILTSGAGAPIVVASGKALVQGTLSPAELASASNTIAVGDRLEPEAFLTKLSALGYSLEPLVDSPGQASRRGGILDVFPPTSEMPVRIELMGQQVESLRLFDPAGQRSLQSIEAFGVGPAREAILPSSRADALARELDFSGCAADVRQRFQDELSQLVDCSRFSGDYFYVPFLATATFIDHLPPTVLIICDESSDVEATIEELYQEARASRAELEARGDIPHGLPLPYTPWRRLVEGMETHQRRLYLSRWASPDRSEDTVRLPFGPALAYGGQLRRLVTDAISALGQGRRIVIVSQQAQRLGELLAEQGITASVQTEVTAPPAGLALVQGSLPDGWHLQEDGVDLSLATDTEVFGFAKQRRARPRQGASRQAFLAELSPGDYVVHVEHGIGRYAGLTQMEIEGHRREYLELNYAKGDRLFVPTDQLERVSRYVGPGEHEPQLTRLGSGDWQRTKSRVRRAVQDLAKDLVALYAAREVLPGYAHSPDTPWQTELEASFPYVETTDQLTAIAAVKRDMEQPRPMDRLVSGDVGYGKTEVAIRAAFKSVMDGRQAALLVPTTVLAQQHFQTFQQRLGAFPLRVEMLSRFRSEAEQRRIIDDLAEGRVDIVIGTHRLLQKDVQFKDLGLVVIDEEQRFGVAHKEHLKKMRREVDVLTLSATPIPRTLYMALGGIRDMSTMETPPEERLPIKTYVSEFDEPLVREAIVRELERGGQIYFVHNRVHNIEFIARKLLDLVPEAVIGVAHGQMPEQQLERVMLDFAAGRIDVLACTTIIESGLDIPNVNTIIVNQADKLGLAQLYQLRGRVGRGAHRAHAYLLFDRKTRLTETAQKRLETIFEATELGAGFQIALRDLEIRGAGNLLGAEQSGNVAAVGFELYSHLLAEVVERLRAARRGETPPPPRDGLEVSLDLPISAHIPESYIPDLNLRLAVYQRLSEIREPEAVATMEEELADRFGSPPPVVHNLLYTVRLRALAIQADVRSLSTEDGQIVLRMKDGLEIAADALEGRATKGLRIGRTLLRLNVTTSGSNWRQALAEVLEALAAVADKR